LRRSSCRQRKVLDDFDVGVGLEGFRELYSKLSIREHEADDAIDIAVHVGGVLHR
jgi:hypothetical protein